MVCDIMLSPDPKIYLQSRRSLTPTIITITTINTLSFASSFKQPMRRSHRRQHQRSGRRLMHPHWRSTRKASWNGCFGLILILFTSSITSSKIRGQNSNSLIYIFNHDEYSAFFCVIGEQRHKNRIVKISRFRIRFGSSEGCSLMPLRFRVGDESLSGSVDRLSACIVGQICGIGNLQCSSTMTSVIRTS